MRRDLVLLAVPRDKGNPFATDGGQGDIIAGSAVSTFISSAPSR
jgi:NAD(P)H-hydrate repair Nnr-like enzyme with NAD(P)H-hydrate dehydratase domain